MAVKYLRSAAAGAGTGADWTNAYTTLTLALAGVAAGDTIYVADDHAETQASALTLTSPGTAAAPVRLLCVNTHTVTPPTASATTATVTTSGNSNIAFAGSAYCSGITFTCGTSSGATLTITTNNANGTRWVFENCSLVMASIGSGSRTQFGSPAATPLRDSALELINTTLGFAVSGQQAILNFGKVIWRDTPSAIVGTVPGTLFGVYAGGYGIADISGVDLSALGSGKSLVAAATSSGDVDFYLRNCKLGASVSVLSGAITSPGAVRVSLDNCDSGSGNTRMEHYKYQGSIITETAKVKSSGASDGTTPLSHKFVSLASGPSLFSPLEGPWMTAWNETTGSALTATVDFLHDSLTNLQNSEIYLEVEYLGTSGFPQSVYSNNRVADVFATPADCPASSATWTTTGLTNPNKQKLQVTFTPTIKGPIRWRVCLIHSNYTVYVDPQASGLAAPSREYLIPGSVYVNETGSAGAAGMLFVPNLDGA